MDNMTDETQNGPQPSTSDTGNSPPVGEGANGTAPVAQPAPPPRTVSVQPPPVSQNPVTGGPQVNRGDGQNPSPLYHDQSDANTTDPRDFHPAVQQASVMRRVAETLAGGPRIKTSIDPNTGETTRTPVPLTTRQVLLGAVANILGGAGQIAGNLSNRMEGRAPNPVQPLPTQQAAQKQAEQSEEDFNQVQNQKLRKAKVLNANMEALRSAFALGKEDDEAKDSVIQNHADDLANWSKAGAVEASNVPSDELMTRGFDKTKYVAIPDGRVPVFNPDGKRVTDSNGVPLSQLTYSVVDGTTQAPLSQDKYNQLAKYGLMSAKEGFKLPEGASISSAHLALMNHKIDLISQTQRELDEVHSAVGGEKVDLAKQIKKNPQMLSAIEQFHNDGASTEPDNQINNLQNSQNPKAKQAAGLMRELFGNANLEKFKQNRIDTDAASKTAANEKARVNAEESTPTGKLKLRHEQLADEDLQLAINKKKADQKSELPTSNNIVNGRDEVAYNSLSVPQQRSAQMLMDGRMEVSPQALRTAFGSDWVTRLATVFPGDATHEGFDGTKAKAYEKMRQDYTGGKSFQRIQASNNALEHLNQYLQASDSIKNTMPGLTSLSAMGAFGQAAKERQKAVESNIEFISGEAAKATHGGVPDKDTVARLRHILESNIYTPAGAQAAARAVANDIKTPLDSLQSGWESGVPFGMVSPLTHMMSPEAHKAYKNLTGETPTWAGRPREPQQQTGGGGELIQNESKQSSPQPKPPQNIIPKGGTPAKDGSGRVVGFVGADGVYNPFGK